VAHRPGARLGQAELYTGTAPDSASPVDKFPGEHWIGCVVPKRHARRSVTRNLLRRQIRAVMARHARSLPAGLWLVRLRLPFAGTEFPSAASDALRRAVGVELDALLARSA